MIPRISPITVNPYCRKPITTNEAGWLVVESFEPRVDYEAGLVDLSHRPKALVQGPSVQELGLALPGQARWTGEAWIGRISREEAVIIDMNGPMDQVWPRSEYHDMTDGWALLGVFGRRAAGVMARLVLVDVERPEINGPVILATRCHGMNIQIVNPKGKSPSYLLVCERSYGQSLYNAFLHVGGHLGLIPVGVKDFGYWLVTVAGPSPVL
jgi:glycine cleavage system aminomethyltransferase T